MTEPQGEEKKGGFKFPGAVATLAIVTLLVWLAALFMPSGRYLTDVDGSPIPGTFERIDSPLSFGEAVTQLVLAPVNGVYGLRNVDSERHRHRDRGPRVRPDRHHRLHHGDRRLHLGELRHARARGRGGGAGAAAAPARAGC
jgi:hypothetical protein